MSLYNMLFGENPGADVLLGALGLTRGDCGRYRDCFLDGGQIVIHTRNGGGNREDYKIVNDLLVAHPLYVRDEDDDFDCTYANFYFRFPPEYAAELSALEKQAETITPSQKWQDLLASLNRKTPHAG